MVKHPMPWSRRAFFSLAAAPLLAQAPKPVPPVSEDDDVIRVDVQLVNTLFSVRDKSGGLVAKLTKDDFEVFEDGQKQTIERLTSETDLPLTLGLLIDVSRSQERLLPIEQESGYLFLQKVLRDKDLAFLMSFGPYTELVQDLTNTSRLLRRGLESLKILASAVGPLASPVPGQQAAGTVLYDAVYLASEDILKPQVGRKAVIVITDGVDTGSKVSRDEAIRAAQKADTLVYSIEYADPRYDTGFGAGDTGTLKRMSTETGGRWFRPNRPQDLSRTFEEIQEELRTQYLLAYRPTNDKRDGSFRKLEIRPKNRNHRVQARKGYFAG